MRITSIDHTQYFEILHIGDDDYSSFQITASVDIVHGSFFGKNIDVHLLNLHYFIKNLGEFIVHRNLTPKLDGTYDSYIQFYQPVNLPLIMVDFSLGDVQAGHNKHLEYSLRGQFEIPPDSLQQIIEDFRKLEERSRQTT
jgi:hypothetical protein